MSQVLLFNGEGPKKATNVSINEQLLATAKVLKVNVSNASERGLAQAVAERQAQVWKEESLEALDSSNQYVEKNGLPLDKHRQF